MLRKALIAGLLLSIISGCGEQTAVQQTQTAVDDCKGSVASYKATIEPIVDKWDDAVKLANQTSRMALANQINVLQEIKREASSADIPDCIKSAHTHLTDSMESTIDGLLAFMSQKNSLQIDELMNDASESMSTYNVQLDMLTTGIIPTPVPTIRALNELTRDDLKALAWADDIDGLSIEEDDYKNKSSFDGFTTEARLQGAGKEYFFLAIATYPSHELAMKQAKRKNGDIKQLDGSNSVTQITDIGDPLYVGGTTGDQFSTPSFALARCGIVVFAMLDTKHSSQMLDYAKAIDQRIQAKCSQ